MMICRSREYRQIMPPRTLLLLLTGVVAMSVVPAIGRAADVEGRDFRVLVDGKPAGHAHMNFNRTDDGTTTVSCDTDVLVKPFPFVKYTYSYRGKEVWKAGRLQSFDSSCNDDGKAFEVAAAAQHPNVRVRIIAGGGQQEVRLVPGDTWLSSYWSQPDAKLVNKTIPIIDADNGRDISAKVVLVGAEQINVGGQEQQAQHFRLEGKTITDLWYDGMGRLIRQDWLEQNHRTVLELARIRR